MTCTIATRSFWTVARSRSNLRAAATRSFSHHANASSSPSSPFHALFGLSEHPNPFIIDSVALKRSFLAAQRSAHPDTLAGRSNDNSSSPTETDSAKLNEAYQTLLSPLKRAEYLLSLRGMTLADEAKLDGGDDPVQHEFITEVMEARAWLEEAESDEEVQQIRRENNSRIQAEVRILEGAFQSHDLDTALKSTIRLRYWEGLEAAARERSLIVNV